MFLAVVIGVTLLSTVSAQAFVGRVAFTAGMFHNQNIQDNQALVYRDVSLNEGNAYDSNTGIFRAPNGGYYVFHNHLVAQEGHGVYLRLCKNNVPVAPSYGYYGDVHASIGNSAVLKLDTGDTVFVRADRTSLFNQQYFNGGYGTFTGYSI